MRPRTLAFIAAAVLSLLVDQATKLWARQALLPLYPRAKTFIPGFWDFRYAENTGAAFSLFRGVPGILWIFVLLALGLAVGAAIYLRRTPLRWPVVVGTALGLVVGGALGNALDRALFGHVTDFVVWKVGAHEWPTFNFADAALVVGIAALFFTGRRADGAKRALQAS